MDNKKTIATIATLATLGTIGTQVTYADEVTNKCIRKYCKQAQMKLKK